MGVKFFGSIVVIMVVTVIIVGLIIAGSPAEERARRFDDEREYDLQQISAAVDLYVSKTGRLPSSLNDLVKPEVARLYNIPSITDPETSAPYEYSTTSNTAYQLCAKFSRATKETIYPNNRAWEHPAGNKCFELLSSPPKS